MNRPFFPPAPLLDEGWYSDPTGRYEARYWDGQKWTKHVSHYGATGTDPILRARFDRLWVRLALRVITWGATILIIYFLVKAFWPTEFLNESSLIHITNHSENNITNDFAAFSSIGITMRTVLGI